MSGQQPLELILARNLMASLSTPAFLVNKDGELVFYNDAAGALIGRRFEETGKMAPEEWGQIFGPFDGDGAPIPFQQLRVTRALRAGKPISTRLEIASYDATRHEVDFTALPIVGAGGFRGAIAVFWPAGEDEPSKEPA